MRRIAVCDDRTDHFTLIRAALEAVSSGQFISSHTGFSINQCAVRTIEPATTRCVRAHRPAQL